MRKSTWQVPEVRRPLVSASHIIQAGNDLFIGKDEAYIMSRNKKEKSMLRKEGNVYVLDLFVRVPDGSDNAFDIQVGMERPAEIVPRDPGEVLNENKVART